jgi:hypothetical protein
MKLLAATNLLVITGTTSATLPSSHLLRGQESSTILSPHCLLCCGGDGNGLVRMKISKQSNHEMVAQHLQREKILKGQ